MYICDKEKQQIYIANIEKLKGYNRAFRKKRQRLRLLDWRQHLRKKNLLSSLLRRLKSFKFNMFKTSTLMPFPVANYFSEHRIAVYTCIIGAYDKLIQPKLKPNNIDYYVITDQPHSPESMWRFLDVSHIKSKLSSLSAVEQNRWYKTHPHLLFQDYDYSVYLDGNITPVSDFTELINRIGPCAIATHRHYCRNCVYEESEAILRSNKDTVERVRQHVRFLQEQGMPKNYGLADCSVIARKHHDIACIGLMEQWWEEFLRNSRRDQLSFPYVLFKNGMSVYDVTTLGSNRVINDALDVTMHIQATRGM